MRLANGLPWSLPITAPVGEKTAKQLSAGDHVKLVKDGVTYGMITVTDIYQPDKTQEALSVFKTNDPAHPGVKNCWRARITISEGLSRSAACLTNLSNSFMQRPQKQERPFKNSAGKRLSAFKPGTLFTERMNTSKNSIRNGRRSAASPACRRNKVRRYPKRYQNGELPGFA